jgi:hypothetical protein
LIVGSTFLARRSPRLDAGLPIRLEVSLQLRQRTR